jgi:hypothetical protein
MTLPSVLVTARCCPCPVDLEAVKDYRRVHWRSRRELQDDCSFRRRVAYPWLAE